MMMMSANQIGVLVQERTTGVPGEKPLRGKT